MDGCLPDPYKKYPLQSDGPANFAFSVIIIIALFQEGSHLAYIHILHTYINIYTQRHIRC